MNVIAEQCSLFVQQYKVQIGLLCMIIFLIHTVSLYVIFHNLGSKRTYAFIPFYRFYIMAQILDKDNVNVYLGFSILQLLIFDDNSTMLILGILSIIVNIICYIILTLKMCQQIKLTLPYKLMTAVSFSLVLPVIAYKVNQLTTISTSILKRRI